MKQIDKICWGIVAAVVLVAIVLAIRTEPKYVCTFAVWDNYNHPQGYFTSNQRSACETTKFDSGRVHIPVMQKPFSDKAIEEAGRYANEQMKRNYREQQQRIDDWNYCVSRKKSEDCYKR